MYFIELGSFGTFTKGKGISKKDLVSDGYPCITYGEIYSVHHDYVKEFYSFIDAKTARHSKKIRKGDLLFAGSGESREEIGKAVAYDLDSEAFAGGDIIIFRQEKCEPVFLGYVLNSEYIKKQLFKLGQGHSVVHIYSNLLSKILVPLPPLEEQKKIAAILSTWDKAIATCEEMIQQLEQRNKGLAQQLLTGKTRLPGFTGEWREYQLDDYFKERKEIGWVDLQLLSVGEKGVYPQSDSNKKDTSNKDKLKYKRICPGDIGYNTMRMWQGRSALSDMEGIVSPAYTIVTPKSNAYSKFFAYLFKLESVVNLFYRNSQGLVSDTLNCKFKDFRIVKVLLPPNIQEQKAIAALLDQGRSEIHYYQNLLKHYQQQKKGLMQQLLTGKVRVKTKEK